jgi:hypothetical protein
MEDEVKKKNKTKKTEVIICEISPFENKRRALREGRVGCHSSLSPRWSVFLSLSM